MIETVKYSPPSGGSFWMVVIDGRFYPIARPLPRRRAIERAIEQERAKRRARLLGGQGVYDSNSPAFVSWLARPVSLTRGAAGGGR